MSEAKFRLLGSTAPQRAACAHAKQQTRTKKKRVRDRRFLIGEPLMDDQVLTFREWCALNGIGLRTGRRILDGPNPPAVVRLSARRIGITVKANREWQESRAHPPGAMTDLALFVVVPGTVAIAVAVDLIALTGWLQSRWP